MLFLDGVYVPAQDGVCFRRVKPPRTAELDVLIYRISERVGRYLERQGLLVRDMENSYLTLESRDDTAMDDLMGHSITYRIAVGPHQGQKAFTLQTLAPRIEEGDDTRLAKAAGFSLHCGVAAAAHQRDKLERLCRYIARPAIANERLALTGQGDVRYRLKTPTVTGPRTSFSSLWISWRAWPRSSQSLGSTSRASTGCLHPTAPLRAQVTPRRRGRRAGNDARKTPAQRRAAMTWAQRLKRVFRIDIETCRHCGGALKIIASIEDPAVINRILKHLARRDAGLLRHRTLAPRAPPQRRLPGLTD